MYVAFADAFGWTPEQVSRLTPRQSEMFLEYLQARHFAARGGKPGIDPFTGRSTVEVETLAELAALFGRRT